MGTMNYSKYSSKKKDFVFDMIFPNTYGKIVRLLRAMVEAGVKPELECFDTGHTNGVTPLLDMGVLKAPLQFSFIVNVLGGIPPSVEAVQLQRSLMPSGSQWEVIGISHCQWRMEATALILGGNVRVGLEDHFYLPERRHGQVERGARREGGGAGAQRRTRARDRRGGAEDPRPREVRPRPVGRHRRRPMSALVVACPSCQKKNRVDSEREGPVCGACGARLQNGPRRLVRPRSPRSTTGRLRAFVIESPLPVLVDFFATWCGPCRVVAPPVEEVARARSDKVRAAKVNVDLAPAVARQFQVTSVPTLVLVRGPREIARLTGAVPAAQLLAWIDQTLKA